MTSDKHPSHAAVQEKELRVRLVEQLVADGNLRSDSWRRAFESVPRHVFVPAFYRQARQPGQFERISSENPATYSDWINSVYDDDVLFTQIDSTGAATSSSTTPGLMALMLEALDLKDGMKVLEIGTGTGYNAALLCHRLGSEHITSVDIDRELIDISRERLSSLGYSPRLEVGDGIKGYEPNAPYDRIISTVAVPSIPASWVAQARHGGRILANLYRELGAGALASVTVDNGAAVGRFLPEYGGFMPIRAIQPHAAISLMHAADSQCQERETQIAGPILDDPSFAFYAAFFVPAQRLGCARHDGSEEFWLLSADGSWVKQVTRPDGGFVVCQHGPRLLWDKVEQAHHEWKSLGSPPRQDFGLTVTADGKHTLWYAHDRDARWAVEPASL